MKNKQSDNNDISNSHSSNSTFNKSKEEAFFSGEKGSAGHFFNPSAIQAKLEIGNNVTIQATTVQQIVGQGGAFYWSINWKTSGKKGFIVQKIEASYNIYDSKGKKDKRQFVVPLYWEAWTVDQNGKIAETYPGDTWGQPNDQEMLGAPAPPRTTGDWSIKGTVYWVDQLDLNKGGWARYNPDTDAEHLLSTTIDPQLTSSPILQRWAKGSWDTTSKDSKNWTNVFIASK